ncbi:MAG: DEAD/DEAH box helicase [Clostridiales bacterium]|nr:DEAD/DEAH box helicase [Clostridiales bacterium]
MNIDQLVEFIKNDLGFMKNITHWEIIEPRKGIYSPFPGFLSSKIVRVLRNRGIDSLFCHQALALDIINECKNVVIVTPTASGKTLCYNLPVLNEILKNNDARSLYLFPTKALSQDQVSELHEMITLMDTDIKTYTYDGDTPTNARKTIRQAGHIVVTNPDMLHSGIMPHHTKWVKLFENLKFVVIDEMHTYRGVFGSHMANVIRRLKRICNFYGSDPTFICCSATIANPLELAQKIIGEPISLIDENGAPVGGKHFIFYNPPLVNRELGIRRSSLLETKKIAGQFIGNGLQSIIFARSRLTVEVLVTYLRELVKKKQGDPKGIRGYRSGYLPTERRQIEKGLREGSILGVVSTNALELGIDIGSLETAIICGYPGSIASTWQQAGRAGRRNSTSIAILVASSNPLDQYTIQHPEYFLEGSPECGLISPNNLHILLSHIKCAAFELPFEDGEQFGVETLSEILFYLEEHRIIRHVGNRWYWMAENFPAADISLRSASEDNFIIIDISLPKPRVIGEVDSFSAPMILHEEAIYIHGGIQFQVERLDFEEKKAYVRKVDVDYYTDANLAVDLKVLDVFDNEDMENGLFKAYGEVMVTALVTMFKKIKFNTHENLGWGRVHLPEMEMHTSACWFSIPEDVVGGFSQDEIQGGLMGIANLMGQICPIFLMCDARDINVIYHTRSPFTRKPTLYIYDSYPGGIGLSDKVYHIYNEIFDRCREVILNCRCIDGCPACIGPAAGEQGQGKDSAFKILGGILDDSQSKGEAKNDFFQLPFQG